MRTVALFQHALEQWENRRPNDRQQVYALTRELTPLCDRSTNLYVVDLSPDDPLDYRLDTLVENVGMRGSRPTFGAYIDQDYVRKDVAPFYLGVKKTGKLSRLTMKSRIQDQFAVYDRLLLPVTEHGSVRWALSITKTRLLLPVEPAARLLTERQEDILSLLSQGHSSKETGRALAISHRTVEHQIEAIKRKLGARNVAHAVALALAQSIIAE